MSTRSTRRKVLQAPVQTIKVSGADTPPSQPISLGPMPQSPTKGTYDQSNTLYAIRLINNFLYTLTNPKYTMTIPGFENNKFYTVKEDLNPLAFTQVSTDGSTLIVCFRGSQTTVDFVTDSQYNYYNLSPPQTPEIARTAPGFTNYYNQLKAAITAEVTSSFTRIFICGHSLGASLAMLLANDLSLTGVKGVEVYGIATPKTGNPVFAQQVAQNCRYSVSVINLADIVPSIISSYMFNKKNPALPCSYSHVQPIAIFNNLQASLQACHLIAAYHEGVISNQIFLIP